MNRQRNQLERDMCGVSFFFFLVRMTKMPLIAGLALKGCHAGPAQSGVRDLIQSS